MMNERVIQIAAESGNEDKNESLVILTNHGRVFAKEFGAFFSDWNEVDLPAFERPNEDKYKFTPVPGPDNLEV